MPFTQDLFDSLDLASITVDEDLIESVTAEYRRAADGRRVRFVIAMKPDTVDFPVGLHETTLTWTME